MIHDSNKGFTLMESLVAIAVFTVGVSAAIFVIQQSFSVGSRVKNKIIAAYLAQEGIEVIRNIRDRNWISGITPWYAGINDGPLQPQREGCVQYDSVSLVVLPCTPVSSDLFFNNSYYTSVADGDYKFSRVITTEFIPLNTVPDPDEPEKLKVTSVVNCGTSCSIALEEYLYNWK